MLDPRLLRSFVVLTEELHFGRAAERLNLAQPALSQQIRRLERQIGVQLYTRDSRSVKLTDGGRAMLEPARSALRAMEQAERAAKGAADVAAHQLRVGVETSLEDMVPTVLAYAKGRPDIALWLSRMHEQHGHEVLAVSQIDAFIGFVAPTETSTIPRVRGIDVPLSAIVRPDHPFARQASVPLSSFRQSPIAIFDRRQSPETFDRFIDLLSEGEGRQALMLHELHATGTGSQVAILEEVSRGHAVSFGTAATLAARADHLRSLPFAPPLSVPTYISWRPDGPVGVGALVEYLRQGQPESDHPSDYK